MEHEIHTHGQQGWQDAEPNLFLPFSPKLHFFFFLPLPPAVHSPGRGTCSCLCQAQLMAQTFKPHHPLCSYQGLSIRSEKKRHLFYKWLRMCLYTQKKGRASHQSSVFTLIAFAKCGKSVTALSAQSRWQQFDFTEHSSRKARVLRHFSLFWYCHVLLTFQNSSCILWLKGSGRSAFTDTFWC